VVNTDVQVRHYAPAGKTPVTFAVGGTRQKLSMIAIVTNQGKTRAVEGVVAVGGGGAVGVGFA
jgi:hypothetical protein